MTRILAVDDEPQILRALATNLRARGYDVELAQTGEAALTIAAREHPDLEKGAIRFGQTAPKRRKTLQHLDGRGDGIAFFDEGGHHCVADGLDQRAAALLDDAHQQIEMLMHDLEGFGIADARVKRR